MNAGIGTEAGRDAVVTFRLCGEVLCLSVASVGEVVPIAWLDHAPAAPSFVHGILNLAGRAVPVLRLDRLLGLGDGCYGLDASILIMRDDGAGRPGPGLLVEHVDGVSAAGAAAMGQGPDSAQSFNGCLADRLLMGERSVPLLDWGRLLLAEERMRLAEFRETEQARLAALGDAPP